VVGLPLKFIVCCAFLGFALLCFPNEVEAQNKVGKLAFDRGYEAYDEGNYSVAVEQYTKAIESDPLNAEYYYHRGVSYSLLSQNEYSIADFNKAIELVPDHSEAFFERAYSKYLLEKNEEAIKDYNKAIDLAPDFGPAYLNRGSVKFDMDDLDGACLDWKKAVILKMEIARELLNEYCPSKT